VTSSRVRRLGAPGTPDHRVEIYTGRLALVVLTLGALAFSAVCAFGLTVGGLSVLQTVGLAVGVPFFGAVALVTGRRLLVRRPVLVLADDGLHDHASGVGLVPWSEITGFSIVTVRGQRMLGVDVVDRDALLARVGPLRRGAVRANLRMGAPPVTIPQTVLPMSVEELFAQIREYHATL
jgi:hypothetical protein